MEDENFNADDFEIVSGEPKVIFEAQFTKTIKFLRKHGTASELEHL